MSNFKKKSSVPQDTDLRQIGDQSFIMGGIRRTSEVLPTSSGSSDPALSGNLQAQIDLKADLSYVDTLSGTLDAAILDIEDFKPANTWYVDGINGVDIGNTFSGSFNHPYKTISAALSGIGNLPLQKIFILNTDPSASTEILTIAQEDLTIEGIGNVYSYGSILKAHLTLNSANRVQLKNLHIRGTISGTPCIADTATSGVHSLDNVTLTHDFSDQLGYQYSGASQPCGVLFSNCNMAEVNCSFDTPANGEAQITFRECINKGITTSSGIFLRYRDAQTAGPFTHLGGGCILQNIQTIQTSNQTAGDAIFSSAGSLNGVLAVSNCSLIQIDGQYGIINKTGDCPYALASLGRDPSLDILGTGFRFYPGGSFDISASYTPVNYTAADQFLPAHLAGIDAALAGGASSARVGNALHVSISGSDISGDGSLNAPYATVEYALSQVPSGLTLNNSRAIMLGAGSHSTPTCKLKPYVALVGLGYLTTRLNVASNKVEIESTGSPYGSNSRNQIHNLQLSGATGLEMDFTPYANASNVLDIMGCWINGPITYTGRAYGAEYLQIYNTYIFGACNLTNIHGELESSTCTSALNITISGMSPGSLGFALHAARPAAGVFITSDNSRTESIGVTACQLPSINLNGAGITATLDAISFPPYADITLAGGAVVVKDKPFARAVPVPSTATSPGLEGDYAVDASYRYDCISLNTWVRGVVATW